MYSAFFGRHFKWMLAVFAILSVFLSALQVGLATPMLQDGGEFQRVCSRRDGVCRSKCSSGVLGMDRVVLVSPAIGLVE
jgi:hypothetical protein